MIERPVLALSTAKAADKATDGISNKEKNAIADRNVFERVF